MYVIVVDALFGFSPLDKPELRGSTLGVSLWNCLAVHYSIESNLKLISAPRQSFSLSFVRLFSTTRIISFLHSSPRTYRAQDLTDWGRECTVGLIILRFGRTSDNGCGFLSEV